MRGPAAGRAAISEPIRTRKRRIQERYSAMGIVIRFPQERRLERAADAPPFIGSATIIILPVVRTERHGDTAMPVAAGPASQRRPNRRRAAVQPSA
jgi:hypothetical protein